MGEEVDSRGGSVGEYRGEDVDEGQEVRGARGAGGISRNEFKHLENSSMSC